eukprot:TRINITY_DN3655_c0_g1_i1.p1 TRINITY_DN3655_c0_g1~~TRINITY_DN3655_c0_g1_i1.p1  ORF type:complete len:627 (+),score=161.19 TRINITY_DN3655_c0_g1_i1:72-1952(+)
MLRAPAVRALLLRPAAVSCGGGGQLLRRSAAAAAVQVRGVITNDFFWEKQEGADTSPHGGYHWFGATHVRAIKAIKRVMPTIDIVMEVRDARVPFSSYNPELEELCVDKPRLVVLNKSDLADGDATRRVMKYFKGLGVDAIHTNSNGIVPRDIQILLPRLRQLAPPMYSRGAPVKVLVVGMPNVGKSSLVKGLRRAFVDELTNNMDQIVKGTDIRKLHRRRIMLNGVDPFPGLTRKLGTVRLPSTDESGGIVLVDSPGIMSPVALNPTQGLKVGLLGLGDWTRSTNAKGFRDRMGYYAWQLCWSCGLEASAMAWFRIPFPPPRTFHEFQARAILALDSLSHRQKTNLRFETDSSDFARKMPAAVNEVSRKLVQALAGGHLGRLTLDEVPELTEEYLATAPQYVQDLRKQHIKNLEQRAAAARLKKKRHVTSVFAKRSAEDPLQSSIEPTHFGRDGVEPDTLYDTTSETLSSSETTAENLQVDTLVARLGSENVPISRKRGPLSEAVAAVPPTYDESRREAARMRQIRMEDEQNRVVEEERRRGTFGRMTNFAKTRKIKVDRGRLTLLRYYDSPNPLNRITTLNPLTGADKKERKREEERRAAGFSRGESVRVHVDPVTGRARAASG